MTHFRFPLSYNLWTQLHKSLNTQSLNTQRRNKYLITVIMLLKHVWNISQNKCLLNIIDMSSSISLIQLLDFKLSFHVPVSWDSDITLLHTSNKHNLHTPCSLCLLRLFSRKIKQTQTITKELSVQGRDLFR